MHKPRSTPAARVLATAVLLVGLAVAVASPASGVIGASAPIYRNSGHTCAGGATDTVDPVGTFTAGRSGNIVSGSVQLSGVAANSDFTVAVVENHPCLTHGVGKLHTDAEGDGAISYKIGVTSSASVVWVYLVRSTHTLVSTAIQIGSTPFG